MFVATFLAEGALRGSGYRPLRHPVSSLALGPRGWVQAANFTVAGTLTLAGAAGLWRTGDLPSGAADGGRLAAVLVGAAGLGLLGSATFATDPVGGYPQGTPAAAATPTPVGLLHNLSAVPVFLGLPAAALSHARRAFQSGEPDWALYSTATAVAMLSAAAMSAAGFSQSPAFARLAGLYQRISITAGFAWLTVASARALAPSRAGRRGRDI